CPRTSADSAVIETICRSHARIPTATRFTSLEQIRRAGSEGVIVQLVATDAFGVAVLVPGADGKRGAVEGDAPAEVIELGGVRRFDVRHLGPHGTVLTKQVNSAGFPEHVVGLIA